MTAPPSASIYFLILVACARGRGRRPIIRAPLDENMRQTVSEAEFKSERADEQGGRGGEEQRRRFLGLILKREKKKKK